MRGVDLSLRFIGALTMSLVNLFAAVLAAHGRNPTGGHRTAELRRSANRMFDDLRKSTGLCKFSSGVIEPMPMLTVSKMISDWVLYFSYNLANPCAHRGRSGGNAEPLVYRFRARCQRDAAGPLRCDRRALHVTLLCGTFAWLYDELQSSWAGIFD